jgi:hypothetical protein
LYLQGAALRLRALLASAAGRPHCLALGALTPRVLFPENPERRWRLLVASDATALSPHGCAAASCTATALRCICDTCASNVTACFAAEVDAATPVDAGLALQLRLLSGDHAGTTVPLLLTQHLSGALESSAYAYSVQPTNAAPVCRRA